MRGRVSYSHYELGQWAASLDTLGQTQTRTTANSYTTQEVTIILRVAVYMVSFLWDLKAGTYELSLDGASLGSQVLGGDTAEVEFTVNQALDAGKHELEMVRAGGAAACWGCAATLDHDWLYYNGISYDGAFDAAYEPPLQAKGYPADFVVVG